MYSSAERRKKADRLSPWVFATPVNFFLSLFVMDTSAVAPCVLILSRGPGKIVFMFLRDDHIKLIEKRDRIFAFCHVYLLSYLLNN